MNNRLKLIRKDQGMSQEIFANRLGYNKNYIYLMESGKNPVTDRALKDICREFKVNETWFRTGEGEMHAPSTREQEVANIVTSIYQNKDEFRTKLIETLVMMNEEQMNFLKDFAIKLAETAKEIDRTKNEQ